MATSELTAVQTVKSRALIMGLDFSTQDAEIIAGKWQSDPLCNLDHVLAGIQRLRQSEINLRLAQFSKALKEGAYGA